MLQSSMRSAALLVLAAGMAATSATAKPPGAPPAAHPTPAPHPAAAPRAAPAPHAAPAARAATPHIAAPRAAPPAHHVAPQQLARPSGAPAPAAAARQGVKERTAVAPTPEKRVGGRGGPGLAQPALRERPGRQPQESTQQSAQQSAQPPAASARIAPGQSRSGQPAQALQPATSNQTTAGRILRNEALANRAGGPGRNASALAGSTFQGRFFDPGWRRHRPHPIVIGWVGPMFWPYAYDDFVDYTFYPHAYDTFWPYAYDDLYEGAFGRYAQGYGGTYAAVGRSSKSGGARAIGTDLCSGQTAGLTDWPIERIAQVVEPVDAQRAALDDLKGATAKALEVLEAACPTALSSTPTGRIEAMGLRLDAMLQAVKNLRPAIENFYLSLNDEQKARFNALGPDDDQDQKQSRRDLTQACGERALGIANVPLDQIERAVRPNEAQRSALRELQDATAEATNLLKADCPSYRALTPVVRLEAMEQRLDAMSRAVHTVQPALARFYGSLGDEQKERFNRLSPARG
jgi:hypothetical protein